MSALISGFHHVCIKTRDWDRTLAFYCTTLGFTEKITWRTAPNRAVMLNTGDGNYLEVFEDLAYAAAPNGAVIHFALRTSRLDEVAALVHTIQCADKAYAEAKELLEPGIEEVEIMAVMLEAATYATGEFLSGWGQDFQAGSAGGFARPSRAVEAGELIPLDIGVGVRGYRCDLCRTFAVDGSPTEEQAAAHARVVEVMKFGESLMKPGQSCRAMFEAVKGELDGWQGYSFFHHAGHGIGLDAHEVPRINPAWDDVFEEGDVIAFEPGLYGGRLRAGIRLENNYLFTAVGFSQLSHFPLDLA